MKALRHIGDRNDSHCEPLGEVNQRGVAIDPGPTTTGRAHVGFIAFDIDYTPIHYCGTAVCGEGFGEPKTDAATRGVVSVCPPVSRHLHELKACLR